MIQLKTILDVADNTGARKASLIGVLKANLAPFFPFTPLPWATNNIFFNFFLLELHACGHGLGGSFFDSHSMEFSQVHLELFHIYIWIFVSPKWGRGSPAPLFFSPHAMG